MDVIDAKKFRIHLVSSDLEGTQKEKGTFRFWSGYISYDGKPIGEVVGNHQTTPGTKDDGTPKSQWIAISEGVSKDERERLSDQGLEPETYGFATISEADINGEVKHTAKIVEAKVFGLCMPLSGWINRKEFEDGKTADTVGLSCKQSDIDFWEDKIEGEYFLSDPEISEKEWLEGVEEIAKDYPGFQNFIKKYFPSSKVENANKRRDLLASLKKKNAGKEEKQTTTPRF